jgi:hypothetical protein
MQQPAAFLETVIVGVTGVFIVQSLTRVLAPRTDARDALLCARLLVLFDGSHSVSLAAASHISTHPRTTVIGRGLHHYRRIGGSVIEIEGEGGVHIICLEIEDRARVLSNKFSFYYIVGWLGTKKSFNFLDINHHP